MTLLGELAIDDVLDVRRQLRGAPAIAPAADSRETGRQRLIDVVGSGQGLEPSTAAPIEQAAEDLRYRSQYHEPHRKTVKEGGWSTDRVLSASPSAVRRGDGFSR